MSGDWIKMECATPEKPEVLALTAAMGWDDPDLTVGKLFRLWCWFDRHTTDGNAVGVTSALLDRQIGVTGFSEALARVGWLWITIDGIQLKNFGKHNGNTAKGRAQTAKRVAQHKSNAQANAKGNASSVSDALPREEKRREEIHTPRARARSPTDAAAAECSDAPAGGAMENLNPQTVEASKAMADAGVSDARPTDAELGALIAQGVPIAEFRAAAQIAGKAGKGSAYAFGVIRRKMADAAAVATGSSAMPWDATRSGIETKGASLGLGSWDETAFQRGQGEPFPVYESRVRAAVAAQGSSA